MTERDPNQPPPAPTDPVSPGDDRPTAAQGSANDSPTTTWSAPANGGLDDVPPTPAQRVVVPEAPRRSNTRWAIALVVTALVAAVGVGAFVLLTGQAAGSTVSGYAPKETTIYGEVRFDLPGDQRQKLGQFLSKFPGFADQAILDTKIDEVLDRLMLAASSGQHDWSTKIKPWFGGELGFSVGALPSPDRPQDIRALAMLTVKDPAKARAWFMETSASTPTSISTHNGTELIVFGTGESSGAMAIADGKVMLIGDDDSVAAAIDSKGQTGFVSSDKFKAALRSIPGDNLAFFYIDGAAYVSYLQNVGGSTIGTPGAALGSLYADFTPPWAIFRIQARGTSLAVETVAPRTQISQDQQNRASEIAKHLPPSTFLLVDAHDYGQSINKLVARLREDQTMAPAFVEVDRLTQGFGGIEGILGVIKDAGFALARDGDGLHGGLVITSGDKERADSLIVAIRNAVSLFGAGSGVTIREETYNGATIGIFDFGSIRELGGSSGVPDPMLPDGRLELAVVSTDTLVAIGIGPSFVKAVIDAGPGASLADDARYKALLDQVGAQNLASAWFDITAMRELAEKLGSLSPEAMAIYEREYKPYLLPLDVIVQATVRDGDLDRSIGLLVVK